MKITLSNPIINDEYTEYVYQAFDIQNQDETSTEVNFSLGEAKNFDWNIGLILGGSGSGKSTILNKLGGMKEVKFDDNLPLISNFDWLSPEDATKLLTSIGLSSVPTWLRPYRLLSNGEQYRAKLAYLIGKAEDNEVILIDEYTSVVDRDVAKAMSNALQKFVRRLNKKVILASCHYDILDWVLPDWICSPENGGELVKVDNRLRPEIQLQVSRVEPSVWELFKNHHYLTEKANKSCKFFLFTWNEKPVGIVALLNAPRKGMPNGFSISRVVVLPDYQGLGIGSKIVEFVSAVCKNEGGKVYIKTVNPALGEYFNKSDKWRGTSTNGKSRKEEHFDEDKYRNRVTRKSYSHEYIGENVEGCEYLMESINNLRNESK